VLSYGEPLLLKELPYYDLEMRQLVGHTHFENKSFDKALPYLEKYVSNTPKVRREDLYELSYCYYKSNNLNKAIEGFKQLSGKQDSLAQNAMYLLADAYLRTNQKEGARTAFQFCSQNSSNLRQKEISQFNYGKLCYELGYQDLAIQALNQFINGYSRSEYKEEAEDLLVQLLARTNNYKEAISILEGLKNPSPESQKYYARILYGRGLELMADEDFDQAKTMLSKSITATGNRDIAPLAKYWLGEINLRQKNLTEALSYTSDYIKQANTYFSGEANKTNATYNLGYIYLLQEKYQEAFKNFDDITNKNGADATQPALQDAYLRSADCWFMLKDYKRAASRYKNISEANWTTSDYAFYQQAIIAGISNKNEKINQLEKFKKTYGASTLIPEANIEIASTHIGQENYNAAITPLKATLADANAAGFYPKAYLLLGIAYTNLNNFTDAAKNFDALAKNYPNSTEAEEGESYVKDLYVENGQPEKYSDYMRLLGKPISVSTEDSLAWKVATNKYFSPAKKDAKSLLENYLLRFSNGAYVLDANYYLAELNYENKQILLALPYYEKVAERAPNAYAERSLLVIAQYYYFDATEYTRAKDNFEKLLEVTTNKETKIEAQRGLLRCNYQLQLWNDAVPVAEELLKQKSTPAEDKVLSYMVIAKAAYAQNDYAKAQQNFKQVISLNKAAFGAEARYYIAEGIYKQNKYKEAEKAAVEVINKAGSYGYWITKAYILLGDIMFAQKDYFNAKATFESVANNATDEKLKQEAKEKLEKVKAEEIKNGSLEN
jgi:TolA-binding protein